MSLWINGEWRPGRGPGFSKQDPVNLKVVWQGEAADAGQVAEAVAAARQAFPSWARLPFAARQAIVEKFAALLEASKAELTAVIGAETGKPRWEAAGEVTAMINKVAISVKAYHVRTGEQHSDLPDGAATLRATYWSNVNEVIAVKPTPGTLFEMEGVVDVYRDRPQLKVESGYKIKLVDDVPASAPAVDVSQAVPVSAITAADLGQARVVKGTLGAPRALRGGVSYALTDDTGTIDLVLWESIIPAEVLNALGEGVQVAAAGEVKEYEGKLQITAASGYSAMVIP